MKTIYHTPGGQVYTLYQEMLSQMHLLVAGAAGSGKSVVLNGIIYTALHDSPVKAQFIMMDPKRVELGRYRKLPHVIQYATEPEEMPAALDNALTIIEQRYKVMMKQDLQTWQGGHVYIIIDELADLMTTQKKAIMPRLQRICQIGRAARVHVIAATQCPLTAVIPTPIKVNFDSCVALRTRSAQDSRNILGLTGCELLPRYGQGYFQTPEGRTKYIIPMIQTADLTRICDYWKSPASVTRRLF